MNVVLVVTNCNCNYINGLEGRYTTFGSLVSLANCCMCPSKVASICCNMSQITVAILQYHKPDTHDGSPELGVYIIFLMLSRWNYDILLLCFHQVTIMSIDRTYKLDDTCKSKTGYCGHVCSSQKHLENIRSSTYGGDKMSIL